MFAGSQQLPGEFARAALEALPSAVAIKDSDLRYVWVNNAFTLFFNVSLESLIGRTNSEVFRADIRLADDEREHDALIKASTTDDLSTFFLPDGTIRETLASHAGYLDESGERWLVSTFHDISDVVDANHLLIEHAEDLTAESDTLRRQALIDPLTETLNRRGLEQNAAIALRLESSDGAGVLAVDIDDFKSVNDTHGHDAGDAVLRLVASVLKTRTRSDDDIVARLGGDEFVVLLPDATASETEHIAERICSALGPDGEAPSMRTASSTPRATVSFSVTVGAGHWPPGASTSFEHRLRAVDELLYAAKRAGRGRVFFKEFGGAASESSERSDHADSQTHR